MNLRTIWKRVRRHLKLLSLACVAMAFAAPTTSFAQSKSDRASSVEQSKGKGGGSDNERGKGKGGWKPGKGPRHDTAPVPEPATWATMATMAALAALLIARQRKLPAAS